MHKIKQMRETAGWVFRVLMTSFIIIANFVCSGEQVKQQEYYSMKSEALYGLDTGKNFGLSDAKQRKYLDYILREKPGEFEKNGYDGWLDAKRDRRLRFRFHFRHNGEFEVSILRKQKSGSWLMGKYFNGGSWSLSNDVLTIKNCKLAGEYRITGITKSVAVVPGRPLSFCYTIEFQKPFRMEGIKTGRIIKDYLPESYGMAPDVKIK